jgi:hypothetical protein
MQIGANCDLHINLSKILLYTIYTCKASTIKINPTSPARMNVRFTLIARKKNKSAHHGLPVKTNAKPIKNNIILYITNSHTHIYLNTLLPLLGERIWEFHHSNSY